MESDDGKAVKKRWRDSRSRAYKQALALTIFLALIGVLSQVHDYPRTQRYIALAWLDAPLPSDMTARPARWTPIFFFFNEAGSGIKYALTADEKHLRHYPTSELIRLRRGGYQSES